MSHRILLVSANVGSLFERPEVILDNWQQQFAKLVETEQPDFFALHVQELGGKSNDFGRNSCMLANLAQFFYEHEAFSGFRTGRAFMDQDNDNEELYTALGSIYLFHQSIADQSEIFSFSKNCYVPLTSKTLATSLNECDYVDRQKFPVQYFPNGRLSRKGFMRTMWSICGTKIELSNIHLFHDDSNIKALQASPSDYALHRRNALSYFLGKLDISVPSFIFGDFNFRTDTKALLSYLINEKRCIVSKSVNKIALDWETTQENEKENALEIEPKKFRSKLGWMVAKDFLRQFDTEMKAFPSLKELPVNFPPTYPFKEESSTGYNESRCPSWCDRALFCPEASRMIDYSEPVIYNLLGLDSMMGDHKPVYASFAMRLENKNMSLNNPGGNNGSKSSPVSVYEINTSNF